MKAGLEYLFWLILFVVVGGAWLVNAIVASYRTRWTWRFREVIREAPKPDERDWLSAFKRSMDTHNE
jgi:hypothetical protein